MTILRLTLLATGRELLEDRRSIYVLSAVLTVLAWLDYVLYLAFFDVLAQYIHLVSVLVIGLFSLLGVWLSGLPDRWSLPVAFNLLDTRRQALIARLAIQDLQIMVCNTVLLLLVCLPLALSTQSWLYLLVVGLVANSACLGTRHLAVLLRALLSSGYVRMLFQLLGYLVFLGYYFGYLMPVFNRFIGQQEPLIASLNQPLSIELQYWGLGGCFLVYILSFWLRLSNTRYLARLPKQPVGNRLIQRVISASAVNIEIKKELLYLTSKGYFVHMAYDLAAMVCMLPVLLTYGHRHGGVELSQVIMLILLLGIKNQATLMGYISIVGRDEPIQIYVQTGASYLRAVKRRHQIVMLSIVIYVLVLGGLFAMLVGIQRLWMSMAMVACFLIMLSQLNSLVQHCLGGRHAQEQLTRLLAMLVVNFLPLQLALYVLSQNSQNGAWICLHIISSLCLLTLGLKLENKLAGRYYGRYQQYVRDV